MPIATSSDRAMRSRRKTRASTATTSGANPVRTDTTPTSPMFAAVKKATLPTASATPAPGHDKCALVMSALKRFEHQQACG